MRNVGNECLQTLELQLWLDYGVMVHVRKNVIGSGDMYSFGPARGHGFGFGYGLAKDNFDGNGGSSPGMCLPNVLGGNKQYLPDNHATPEDTIGILKWLRNGGQNSDSMLDSYPHGLFTQKEYP